MEFQISLNLPTTTAGFNVYWRFASERQHVYHRRLADEAGALTDDSVIAANRFTNAYRASDRVSQYLITDVIYSSDWSWSDTFARVLIFKVFNRIDTWAHLVSELGEVTMDGLMTEAVDGALAEVAGRRPIYSAAYIMPPPRNHGGPKYHRHLSLLRKMIDDGAHERIALATTMGDAYEVLASYESIGPFLAYQFVTDLNYSSHLDFGEDEFVVPGPGALRGIRKCIADPGDLTPPDLIRWMADQQELAFARRGLWWHDLWGRRLQLIDIQNLFCEVDKYTRQAHPELSCYAPGSRIKQRYRPVREPLTAWFPPKWGINHLVPRFGDAS